MPPRRDKLNDPLREVDFGLLITLDALLKCGSVTRAAKKLELTQSAVSHALVRLRALFGDPLFIKSHNKLVPTPKALALADAVASLVAMGRETLSVHKAFDPANARRTITLCLDDMGELAILARLMAHLRVVAPECSLRTVPATVENFEELVEKGDADLGVTGPQPATANVMQQKLYGHRFAVIASRRSPLKKAITAEQYAALEHIAYAPAIIASPRSTLDIQLGPRRIRLSTPHMLVVPLLVEQDPALIAVVPMLLARTYARFADIKLLEPAFELPKIEVFQFWHKRFDTDPFNVWLRGCMRSLFHNNPSVHID